MCAVVVGLLPGELVLRGPGFPQPKVFTKLLEHDGTPYLPIAASNNDLSVLLTGKGYRARLLISLPIFAELTRARDAAFDEHCKLAKASGDDEVDPTEALGLDAPPAEEPEVLDRKKKPRSLLPMKATAEVSISCPGFDPWSVRVLLRRRGAVAIEATEANLRTLVRITRHQVENVQGSAPPRSAAAKRPRGPDGRREYWRADRQRWIVKELQAGARGVSTDGVPSDSSAGRKRYRTLARRPSNETDAVRRARAAEKRRLAPSKKRRSEPSGGGEAEDCLAIAC